jgi:hypothetical protein
VSTVATRELTDAEQLALERCCDSLEAEVGRQTQILQLCERQGEAARARDIDALESATRELTEVMNAVLRAEPGRLATIADAARGLGVPPQDLRLSRLIHDAPEPWRARLADIRRRLKTVVAVTQRVVEANARHFRESGRTADRLLAEVLGDAAPVAAYTREGRQPHARPAANALFNVAG